MLKKWKKLAIVAAATLVAVPSAVVLSACGNDDKHQADGAWQTDAAQHWHSCVVEKDGSHKFDLGDHVWGDDNICDICNYQMTDAKKLFMIKTAWENLLQYQGGLTGAVSYLGDPETMVTYYASLDLGKSIGYCRSVSQEDGKAAVDNGVMKVFQDGNRYIYYSGYGDEHREFKVVDKTYIQDYRDQYLGNAAKLNLSSIFNDTLTEENFAYRVVTYVMELMGGAKDWAKYLTKDGITASYIVSDGVLTAKLSATTVNLRDDAAAVSDGDVNEGVNNATAELNSFADYYTGDIEFTIANGMFTSLKVKVDGFKTSDGTVKKVPYAAGEIGFTFDQAAFDAVEVLDIQETPEWRELQAAIGQPYSGMTIDAGDRKLYFDASTNRGYVLEKNWNQDSGVYGVSKVIIRDGDRYILCQIPNGSGERAYYLVDENWMEQWAKKYVPVDIAELRPDTLLENRYFSVKDIIISREDDGELYISCRGEDRNSAGVVHWVEYRMKNGALVSISLEFRIAEIDAWVRGVEMSYGPVNQSVFDQIDVGELPENIEPLTEW